LRKTKEIKMANGTMSNNVKAKGCFGFGNRNAAIGCDAVKAARKAAVDAKVKREKRERKNAQARARRAARKNQLCIDSP
jgi:hypothetical protein